MARLRSLVIRHSRWSLAALAVAGVALGVLADRLLPDLVAQNPVTANVAAGILGAPMLLLLAVLLLDRLVAAERRRGWVNRNYDDLHVSVPAAVATLKAEVSRHWPSTSSYDDVYAATVSLIEGLEEIPGRHARDTDPVAVPGGLVEQATILRGRLPPVDDAALVDAITSLAAALEPLAMQQDAPPLSEVALDTRLMCRQAASTLDSDAYRVTQFLRLLDDLAGSSPVWDTAEKAFVAERGNVVTRFNPQYLAHSGFGYLEQFSLMSNLEALCDAMIAEIKRTTL